MFYETDYDVVYNISVNWRCRVKKYGKVLVNLLFGVTESMTGLSGNITESSIPEEKLKSSRRVSAIWLNFSEIGRQVISLTWD
ncbi:hypothetical protein SynBIOSE41_03672 [Synechococcus sp. BIOS-E4-1]|nr:hypothetical protein SynBIOSE41_03672 [Synechococcus sp. BIOS-E4-1]